MKIIAEIYNKSLDINNELCFKLNCEEDVQICSSIISGNIYNLTTNEVMLKIMNDYVNSINTNVTDSQNNSTSNNTTDLSLVNMTNNKITDKKDSFYLIYSDLENNFSNYISLGILDRFEYNNKNISNSNRNFMFKNNKTALDRYWLDVESGKF